MAELITELIAGEPYEYYPLGTHIVRAVGVCDGRPTFKYTRIEVEGILVRVASGTSIDEIIRGYGGRVTREGILEALRLITDQFIRSLPALEHAA